MHQMCLIIGVLVLIFKTKYYNFKLWEPNQIPDKDISNCRFMD